MEIIDKSKFGTKKEFRFEYLGWKCLLQTRSGTSRLLLLKTVVRGLGLQKGTPIYSYMARDDDGRPVMITYLDGKHRDISKQKEGETDGELKE